MADLVHSIASGVAEKINEKWPHLGVTVREEKQPYHLRFVSTEIDFETPHKDFTGHLRGLTQPTSGSIYFYEDYAIIGGNNPVAYYDPAMIATLIKQIERTYIRCAKTKVENEGGQNTPETPNTENAASTKHAAETSKECSDPNESE